MSRKSAAEIKILILKHLQESGISVRKALQATGKLSFKGEAQNVRNLQFAGISNDVEETSLDDDVQNVGNKHAIKVFQDLEKNNCQNNVQNITDTQARTVVHDKKLQNSYVKKCFKDLQCPYDKEVFKILEESSIGNAPWDLGDSPLGGVGVFATKNIKAGELIFEDFPVVLGPRAVITTTVTCVVCYGGGDLQACSRGCGLPVCGIKCAESKEHLKECAVILSWRGNRKLDQWDSKLLECSTPIRSLLLNDFQKDLVSSLQAHKSKQHGFEVDNLKKMFDIAPQDEDFMRLVCSVLDANAFEVSASNETCTSSLRGIYPLASLTNHNCVPNATHVFDGNQRMIVRAAVDIQKGEEIFHSYTRLAWGTVTRRFHLLRTKHFLCSCPRCLDPSEYGTHMSAILCKQCGDFVLPKISANIKNDWECKSCKTIVESERIAIVLSVLGSLVDGCRKDSVDDMAECLKLKFPRIIPSCNEIAIELKLRIVWILGWKKNYFWTGIRFRKNRILI